MSDNCAIKSTTTRSDTIGKGAAKQSTDKLNKQPTTASASGHVEIPSRQEQDLNTKPQQPQVAEDTLVLAVTQTNNSTIPPTTASHGQKNDGNKTPKVIQMSAPTSSYDNSNNNTTKLRVAAAPFKPMTTYNAGEKEQQRVVSNRSSAPSPPPAGAGGGGGSKSPPQPSAMFSVHRRSPAESPKPSWQRKSSSAEPATSEDEAASNASQSKPTPAVRRVMRPVPVPVPAAAATTATMTSEDEAEGTSGRSVVPVKVPRKYRLNPYTTTESAFEAVSSPTGKTAPSSAANSLNTVGTSTLASQSGGGGAASLTSTNGAGEVSLVNAFAPTTSPGSMSGHGSHGAGGRSSSKARSFNSSSKDPSPASLLVSPEMFPAAPSTSPAMMVYGQVVLPPSETWNNQQYHPEQQQHKDTYHHQPQQRKFATPATTRSHSEDSSRNESNSSHGPTPTNTVNSYATMTPPPPHAGGGCYYSAPPPRHHNGGGGGGGNFQGTPTAQHLDSQRVGRTSSGPQSAYNGSFGRGPAFSASHQQRFHQEQQQKQQQQHQQSTPLLHPRPSPTAAAGSVTPGLASIDLDDEEEGEYRNALQGTPPVSQTTTPNLGAQATPQEKKAAHHHQDPSTIAAPTKRPSIFGDTIVPTKSITRGEEDVKPTEQVPPVTSEAAVVAPRRYADLVRSSPVAVQQQVVPTAPSAQTPAAGLAEGKKQKQPRSDTATDEDDTTTCHLRVHPTIKPSPLSKAKVSTPSKVRGNGGAHNQGKPALLDGRATDTENTVVLHQDLMKTTVSYFPFPSAKELETFSKDPAFAQAPLPKSKMTRVFLGQLPYTTPEVMMQWIGSKIAGGLELHYVEKITKNSQLSREDGPTKVPTGCFHAYVRQDQVETLLVGMHKKILVDENGLWVARYPGAVGEDMLPSHPTPGIPLELTAVVPAPVRSSGGGHNKTSPCPASFPSLGQTHGEIGSAEGALELEYQEDIKGLIQLRSLREYCAAMRQNPALRFAGRPYGAVVAQVATSNYNPDAPASSFFAGAGAGAAPQRTSAPRGGGFRPLQRRGDAASAPATTAPKPTAGGKAQPAVRSQNSGTSTTRVSTTQPKDAKKKR